MEPGTDQSQAEDQLKAISEMRDLMNKSSRFISMSGLSGVAAGAVGLIGMIVTWLFLDSYFFHLPFYIGDVVLPESYQVTSIDEIFTMKWEFVRNLVMIAGFTLAGALFGAWYFTRRKAKKLGLSMWDDTAKRMTINLLIPLVTGGGFALVLLSHGIIGLVPAITLAFYGTALINASKYTLNDIRYLGIIQIILSFIAAIFYEYSLILWSIGFGVMHIIYGIVLYMKYENKKA
ncbi:MAG TPA: hypothetical protein VK826_11510 [Bacteroidia bacterium]|nr:hypothetical protein [Bacteroidia bacterium]